MALQNTSKIEPIIIIPVYNGRDSIIRLLTAIRKLVGYPILVVDDGSTDGLDLSKTKGIQLIQHKQNRGKGAALKSGLSRGKQLGYSHAITLDADGQHTPLLIDTFIRHTKENPAAFIVGNRDLANQKMPLHRKLSNNITSLILSLRSGRHIRDGQVGYRCYPLNDSRLWDSPEDGFQFESAVFFNAAKLHMPLIWLAIPVIYGDEDSHMDLFKDTLRFIRTFFRSFKW